MSNLDRAPSETTCGGGTATAAPAREVLTGRDVPLGRYTVVSRYLPHKERRTVGAWCFVDHFGPDDVRSGPGMRVPPHPHTGLQTVSWLLSGEVLHRDSLGHTQTVRPGALNLMTAGHGIAHSEESPGQRSGTLHGQQRTGTPQRQHSSGTLHGLQLWVALPSSARQGPAAFAHHPDLPVLRDGGVTTTVFAGTLAGATSPARVFTPLLGAEAALAPDADARLPLDPDHEYAVLLLTGAADVDGDALPSGAMVYLGRGRRDLALASHGGGRVVLLGGEPFSEQLVMWWNFVGRTHEDVVAARTAWEAERQGLPSPAAEARAGVDGGPRFGTVHGYDGDPLPAPPLPATRLVPRGRTGRRPRE